MGEIEKKILNRITWIHHELLYNSKSKELENPIHCLCQNFTTIYCNMYGITYTT